jgi:hypothetical protein
LKTAEWFENMSIVHEMLVCGFSLPFYKLLQEMPMCGVFLITRDFHITIKEDKSLCDSCSVSYLLATPNPNPSSTSYQCAYKLQVFVA